MTRRRPAPRKAKRPPKRAPVNPSEVRLEAGKGSKDRGGGPGGAYWHIYVGDRRAGNVYVNVIDEEPIGEHASIQIQVNAAEQGKGIGSIAYRLAADASEHSVIYAHMRKSNRASRLAAEHAGFVVVDHPEVAQLLMVRHGN
jgi:RimJ/RimL family protein N-acetyltransferase